MVDKYLPIFELGSGSFGKAWVMKERTSEEKVVAKIIQIKNLSKIEKDRCITEVAILSACKHANIVRYIEAFVSAGSLHIIMEYAQDGDLYQRLRNQQGKPLSREVVLDWFVQIVLALEYIHNRNILHRDLKPQNVFLAEDGTVKLGDFGISKVLCSNEDLASTMIGTPYYISPEICYGKQYNSSSDMWAAGCLLYQMCHLKVPFDATSLTDLAQKIGRCQFKPTPKEYGITADYLITKLLMIVPDTRLTAKEILCLPELSPFVTVHKQKQVSYKKLRSDSRSLQQVKVSKRSDKYDGRVILENKSSNPNEIDGSSENMAVEFPEKEGRKVSPIKVSSTAGGEETKSDTKEEQKDLLIGNRKNLDNQSCAHQGNNMNGISNSPLGVNNFRNAYPADLSLDDRTVEDKTRTCSNKQDTMDGRIAEGAERNWSDKSHRQPARLKSKTYTVKESVARKLSEASPKLSDTIAKQRFALSVGDPEALQQDKYKDTGEAGLDAQDLGIDEECDEVFTPSTGKSKRGQKTVNTKTYVAARNDSVDANNNSGVSFSDVNATIIEALSVQGFNKALSRRILYNGLVSHVGEARSAELLTKVRKTIIKNGQSYQTLTRMMNVEELELIPLIGMLSL